MNKKELIEYCESLKGDLNKFINGIDVNKIIKKIEQLDEPQKVTIPQFVADWYEECKDNLEYNLWSYIYNWGTKEECDFKNWLDLGRNNPIQTLINMHQFGYEVEKEKRYLVKMKGVDSCFECLYYGMGSNTWSFRMKNESGYFRRNHTRKELEKAGFGWVFDCPGIEIEEVEG